MEIQDQNVAPVAMDEAMLAKLAGMANADDAGAELPKIPVLKINYSNESKIASPGDWVVGQIKDKDGKIEDQGQRVKAFVPILMRYRYSLYVQGDTGQNCSSQFVTQMGRNSQEVIMGDNYGNVCNSGTCPKRNKELRDWCKANIVLFGTAITESNQAVDCVVYFKGSAYVPIDDYIKSIKSVKNPNGAGRQQIPLFSYLTLLSSEFKPNGAEGYYLPILTKGTMLDDKHWPDMVKKREDMLEYISAMNKSQQARIMGKQAESGGGGDGPYPVSGEGQSLQEAVPDAEVGVVDTSYHEVPEEGVNDDAIPFNMGQSSETEEVAQDEVDDIDIDSAIMQALNPT